MKIIQVLAGAEFGGAETAFVDMCIAQKEAGQDVVVVTRANKVRVPRLKAAGIRVYTLPFGSSIDVYTLFALRRIIKKERPSIVQSWMSRASQKVTRWSAGMGIPRYFVVSRLGGYYKFKNFKNTDYFVTITPDIKRYLVEDCGVDSDRVRHINNFAETDVVEVPVKRSDYNVSEDAPLCLCLGRLHCSKAFDFLIKVFAELPDVYLWIAGEGPDRVELEALIEDLDLSDRVTLLGWRSDRGALFEAADICIFPSRYEPFGTVFVQAWAQKVPLVTTNAAGPKQFVRDGEDGLMVPIDDESAMVAAVRRVVDDFTLRERLVERGYARYLAEFTKAVSVQAYQDYYEEIMARETKG